MGGVSGFILIAIGLWHFEPIPGATRYISLDTDSSGAASVAYCRDDTLFFSTRTAATDSFIWTSEVVDTGVSHLYYGSVELTFDEESKPHLVYFKPIAQGRKYLYYAVKNQTGWHRRMLDSTDYYWHKPGLDTDTLDRPHIVFWGDSLWHLYWNGIKWNKEFIDDNGFSEYVSLMIDQENNLHISLGPAITKNRQGYLRYGFRDSSGWSLERFDQFDVRWPVGIGADINSNPHLGFSEFDPYSWHMMKQSGSWVYDNLSSFGYFDKIAIDDTIVHLLGFSAGQNGDPVCHVWKPDTGWRFEYIHAGYPRDFVIDRDRYLHCVIDDSNRIIYGTTRPQVYVEEGGSSPFESFRIATISLLPLRIPVSESVERIRIMDVSGRLAADLPVPRNSPEVIWHGLDKNNRKVGNGIYFIILEQKGDYSIKKVIILE